MKSGTPEVPEIFNLPEDPFPHLRIRDALFAASAYIAVGHYYHTRSNDLEYRTHSYSLEKEMANHGVTENTEKETLGYFFAIVGERYKQLPTEMMSVSYMLYWGILHDICAYHQIQSEYGHGTDRPDPGSDDEYHMKFFESDVLTPTTETSKKGSEMIGDSDFSGLLDLALQTELTHIERLGVSEGRREQQVAGIYSAHADARILLFLMENSRRSPRFQLND